jgi:clan AA aspartic protease
VEIVGSIRNRVPLIEITLRGRTLQACVDTGFNGALKVPIALAKDLHLDHVFDVEVETASGEKLAVEAYAAEWVWLGRATPILALTTRGSFALVGMELLESARLEMEASKGVLRISS